MYILDEREYTKELLKTKAKPKDMSVSYLITLLAKYFVSQYRERDDVNGLICMVKLALPEFNITGYQEYIYSEKIKTICSSVLYNDEDFKFIDYIPVYASDIAIIDSLASLKQKKLMFSLIVVSRYMNCGGWINKKNNSGIIELFKLAQIKDGSSVRNKMLYDFSKLGLIEFARSNTNRNIKVCCFDNTDGDIVYKVTEIANLGDQYVLNMTDLKYKQCCMCGKMIKIKSNRTKYCSDCKKIQIKQNKLASYYKHAENE